MGGGGVLGGGIQEEVGRVGWRCPGERYPAGTYSRQPCRWHALHKKGHASIKKIW